MSLSWIRMFFIIKICCFPTPPASGQPTTPTLHPLCPAACPDSQTAHPLTLFTTVPAQPTCLLSHKDNYCQRVHCNLSVESTSFCKGFGCLGFKNSMQNVMLPQYQTHTTKISYITAICDTVVWSYIGPASDKHASVCLNDSKRVVNLNSVNTILQGSKIFMKPLQA